MRYLSSYNEALINIGKIDKLWLQNTLRDLNALHTTTAVTNFKNFASDKNVKAIWRCDYNDNDFHIIFLVEKEEYDIIGRNQITIMFYIGNRPIHAIYGNTKTYKTEITVQDIVNALAYSVREQEKNNNYANSMDTFFNQLTPEDVEEILIDLTDIIDVKPSIEQYDLQYDIEYDLESFDGISLGDSLEIEPDDNYLKLINALNNINHKLRNGYDSALYFTFDKYYQNLSLKIEYKK